MFIKLTESGKDVYLNIFDISSIRRIERRGEMKTFVQMTDAENYLDVSELPEQIITMIDYVKDVPS